ncbi:Rrf2 family transcriptional regulator [Collinsella tanakaei]|uniref:Rrf2 family transcriptional regulator n=1 Tax=Collinsella tanakaei TaxID=626935 RepID=UPI001956D38F|nr:Rrf2 family transcriptional regulator [Collinsella tanakaei]MBM6867239.1 Rrf2 family transcriptional regulator [Collinsella tanakaei]
MQISTRFTIAVHVLLAIGEFSPTTRATSTFLGKSVNANPVVIRRSLGQLKDADLVNVEMGAGGATLARPADEITLLDIYRAVESSEEHLFNFHESPNPECPVGRNVHAVLDGELAAAQQALEDRLAQTTLADLLARTDALIAEQEAAQA